MIELLLDRGADGTLITEYVPTSPDIKALLASRGVKLPVYTPRHRETRRGRYDSVEHERGRRRGARYTLSAIPTMFEGRQYRSRLEARWAAFMLLCGWEHEYEHLDLNGWIPDFAIWGDAGNTVWVEVKPDRAFPRDVALKMEQGLPGEYRARGDELLILGASPSPTPRSASLRDDRRRLGWLARPSLRSGEEGWDWSDCVFGRWGGGRPVRVLLSVAPLP